MLIQIYMILQVISLVLLGLGFISFNGRKKQFLFSFLACFLFLYLAFASSNIQTENCDNLLMNSTLETNTTTYVYEFDCEVNNMFDGNQMYFNIGLSFLALAYSIGLVLTQKGVQ